MGFQQGLYRTRQFWLVLWARPNPEQLELARQLLAPAQFELFQQLQPSEVVHALSVCHQLMLQGHQNTDLLVAALLHDIGKVKHPLRVWERVVIVLGVEFFPRQAAHWGLGAPQGWRRPFVISAKHPVWGAEMASDVDASPRVQKLIRHHQDSTPGGLEQEETGLLMILQAVDNNH